MDNRHDIFAPKHHGFSRKSLLIGAVFVITLAAALCVDVDALLEYLN